MRDTHKRSYCQALRAKKRSTLRALRKLDLVLDDDVRRRVLAFWNTIDYFVDSEMTREGDLSCQMGAVLSVLVEMRQMYMDLQHKGKLHSASASSIRKELAYMRDAFQDLEQLVDSFFFSYGGRRASLHSVHSEDGQDEENQGGAENADAAGGRRGSHLKELVNESFDETAWTKPLVIAALQCLDERLSTIPGEDLEAVGRVVPELLRLRRQVESFRTQGYSGIVLLGYVADIVGKAHAVAFNMNAEARHRMCPALAGVFTCARANMWAVLSLGFGIKQADVPAVEEADVEGLLG